MEKSASDIAYDRIRAKIIEGEYRPSQRLVEANLAASSGVSRHNVRVALDRLHAVGLVRIEPNGGATVAALTLEDALDTLVAREALEAEVAHMAAPHMSRDIPELICLHGGPPRSPPRHRVHPAGKGDSAGGASQHRIP